MTTPTDASSSGGGFGARDWASVISGSSQGASNAMSSMAQTASSKKEAKEAKRRTLARLFNNALKRNLSTHRAQQEYSDDMSEYKSDQMKDMARGFVDSLKGSTGRI